MADDSAGSDGAADESTPPAEKSSTTGEVESTPAEEPKGEEPEEDVAQAEESEEDAADEADDADETDAPAEARPSHLRLATIAGLALVLALGGLTGWLGFRAYESHRAEQQRALILQVGRQGALNLTTIDWQQGEADVQRVLDSATGPFYDDFQRRRQPFTEVLNQSQSKSVGTIAEAGLESESENGGQVLVAVDVTTTNAGAPEQQPRAWRMRISVENVGDEAKVSNVEFVP